MTSNWRLRSLLTLGLVLLAIYSLVPTLGHFDQLTTLPFYTKLFPKEEIKLGLDLRGGIYTEVEVVLKDALLNRSDLMASEIRRLLEKESYAPETIDRISDSDEIKISLEKEEDRSSILRWLNDNYRNVLLEKKQAGEANSKFIFLDLTQDFIKKTSDTAVHQAVETIRNRIDRYGVSEPTIVRVGDNRIAIELPGMTDPDRAFNLIKQAGRLEFRLVDDSLPDAEIKKKVQDVRETLKLPEGYSIDVLTKINESLKGQIPESSEIAFELQYDPITKKVAGGIPYLIQRKAEVTGDMLKNTQVNIQDNEPYVSLNFNNLGTHLFAELTKANIGKRLAIVLDGNVTKAPVIKSEIPSGQAQITLGFGDYTAILKEAEDLTLVLREGALPARVKELTKTVVGPSLGQDSIQQGIRVYLAAGALIMIFMAFYYRVSGLLANVALLLNMLFILASLALFQATLTLPGIAGIVLTIGMAVDANVLIFERIREEIRAGKSSRTSLQEGYKHAMSAIIDSNVTTFLAGIVLYQFGTGPIRGFAVTLMIGITTTLYTGIIVTRLLQEWLLYGLKREKISI